MRKVILNMIVLSISISIYAQNSINTVLKNIDNNNITLQVLRQATETRKLENKTDIYLPDPEIEFNYLWGNPYIIGNRYDVSVTQEFDLSTLLGLKLQISNQKNYQAKLQYMADRMRILLNAKLYCLDLIYYNASLRHIAVRLEYARAVVNVQKSRLESGEGNILDYNNVCLRLSSIEGEKLRLEAERDAILSQLVALNGGKDLVFNDFKYPDVILPVDFKDWYAKAEAHNPTLMYIRYEVEVNRNQLLLSKLMGLPSFSVGYMRENTLGECYQGIALGISVPLWSNKNHVKRAKSVLKLSKDKVDEAQKQLFFQFQMLYNRAVGLKKASDMYHYSLHNSDNTALLKKALDAGQISILEYILEMSFYYDIINQALDAERNYQKAFAEFSSLTLF